MSIKDYLKRRKERQEEKLQEGLEKYQKRFWLEKKKSDPNRDEKLVKILTTIVFIWCAIAVIIVGLNLLFT